jgi:hypothetical protein
MTPRRWTGGRVAEGARLESVFALTRNVGSNPTLSAIHPFQIVSSRFKAAHEHMENRLKTNTYRLSPGPDRFNSHQVGSGYPTESLVVLSHFRRLY